MKLTKLNLGSGYEMPIGYVNVDKLDYGQEIIADILEGLPFEDNRFDFVLMNHVLQMFTYNEHEAVLKEVRRVMKPGATLRILVPDLRKALNALQEGHVDYFPISNDLAYTITNKFARYIFWHGETRCAFDERALSNLLQDSGFDNIRPSLFGECELDSREEESLIMTCQK